MANPEAAAIAGSSSVYASDAGESWAAKAAREASVVSGGILTGVSHGVDELKRNPGQLAANVAGTVGLVLAMRGPTPLRAVATGAAVLGGAAYVKEVGTALYRSVPIVADTWQSGRNTEVNRALIARELGPVAFDTFVMGALGAATVKALDAPRVWRNFNESDLVPRYVLPNGLPRERVDYTHAANYFQSRPSIVNVNVRDASHNSASGTGFFVSEDGLFVTARHVLYKGLKRDDAKTYEAMKNGMPRVAHLLAEDHVNDLAVFKVVKIDPHETYAPLRIAKSTPGKEAGVLGVNLPGLERVPMASPGRMKETVVIGERGGPALTLEEGLPAGAVKHKLDTLTAPGASGGPVLNRNGEVIGVSTHAHRTPEGEKFTLITPVEPLAKIVAEAQRIARPLVRDPEFKPFDFGHHGIDDGARAVQIRLSEVLNRSVVESRIGLHDAFDLMDRSRLLKSIKELEAFEKMVRSATGLGAGK